MQITAPQSRKSAEHDESPFNFNFNFVYWLTLQEYHNNNNHKLNSHKQWNAIL